MRTWLIDTGPLVAYLDAGDPEHRPIAARLDGFTGGLATTSAVIVEAMHLVSASSKGPRVLAEFVEALDIEEILTLDRRGFRTYRTRLDRALRLVLDA